MSAPNPAGAPAGPFGSSGPFGAPGPFGSPGPNGGHRPLPDDPRPLLPDVLRSEWTKLRSVRSTYWTLAVAIVAVVGLAALLCAVYVARYDSISPSSRATFDPARFPLIGVFLAQLAVGVLGVLVFTSEYQTGMIRSTLAVVPQRRLVLAGKALVFTALTTVVGVASTLAAFFVGQAILSGRHLQIGFTAPGVARTVVGAGLYLAGVGLLGLALGALLRRTAGSIAALFGLLLVIPVIVATLPGSWSTTIAEYLPSDAGQDLFRAADQGSHVLSPWVGFALFCAYAAALLLLAALAVTRRDA